MSLKHFNTKGSFSLGLIVLMLISAIIGGVVTYLWVMGYYVSIGFRVPENLTTLTITNATFNPEDPLHFNLTVLNPSYSSDEAEIPRIAVSIGDSSLLYNVDFGGTLIVGKGEVREIVCGSIKKGDERVGWGEFAGEEITIYVFAEGASAALRSFKTPYVKLHVEEAVFNSKVSVKYFTLTVKNDGKSVISLEIKNITLGEESVRKVEPSLPVTLLPGESKNLRCDFDWQSYMGETPKITVETSRGYRSLYEFTEPLPKICLTVSNVTFLENDIKHFNLTIENSADSSHYVDIAGVILRMENGQEVVLNGTAIQYETDGTWNPLTPYYRLNPNSSKTFKCSWDWTDYRNQRLTVIAYTKQGFKTEPPCGEPFTVTTPP